MGQDICRRRGIIEQLPRPVLQRLTTSTAADETLKTPLGNVQCELIGTNSIAAAAAAEAIRQSGFNVHILTTTLEGEARHLGREIAALGVGLASGQSIDAPSWISHPIPETLCAPCCLIIAGEPTVHVRGRGKGGRMQELALAAAIHLAENHDAARITLLAAGTDGQDGPTDAAGAVVTSRTVAAGGGIAEAVARLEDNDAYPFLSAAGALLKTGRTGTNVMDLMLLTVDATTSAL